VGLQKVSYDAMGVPLIGLGVPLIGYARISRRPVLEHASGDLASGAGSRSMVSRGKGRLFANVSHDALAATGGKLAALASVCPCGEFELRHAQVCPAQVCVGQVHTGAI